MKELSKMSKKEKKEYYASFRNVWTMCPTTRVNAKTGKYNRNAEKASWKREIL